MPLNNSGPLSFGGSTVGQSINLELGLSATATASINSTAFRTLAGVPSGQISISNFYGKSNAIGWVVNTGNGNGVGGLIVSGAGIFVDAVGNMYWIFGQSPSNFFGIGRVSASGTLDAFIYPFVGNSAQFIVSSSRSSTATTAALNGNTQSYVLYGATLNRVYPGTVGTTNLLELGSGAITASNELVLSALENFNGYGGYPTIILINSAGTSSTSYRWNSTFIDRASVVIRTDGTIVQMWREGSTTAYYPYTSSLSPGGTKYTTGVPTTGGDTRFYPVIDSSNNIFIAYQGANYIERVNSSYTMTNRVRLRDNSGELFFTGFSGLAVHGSSVYVLASAFGSVWVISLSASNLSMQWANRFQLNDGATSIAPVQANFTNAIFANANGVYFGVQSGGGTPSRLIKMPLTGMPSNSNAAGISWTIQSWSVLTDSVGAANNSMTSPTLRSQGTRDPVSAGSSITPTATKTDIV
jgi:hypothetical protein